MDSLPASSETALSRRIPTSTPIPRVDAGASTGPSHFNLKEICFAVFRHKLLVLACTFAGIFAAILFWLFYPAEYESSAKLLVRYVVERSAVDSVDNNTVSNSSRNTESVIASEVEILTSWDLAVQVAGAVGPKRLLPRANAPTKEEAAGTIIRGLKVGSQKGNNIIFVSYSNHDPQLAPIVLDELIRQYFNKHLEVHRSAGAFDFVTQQIDRVKARLSQTEDALVPLKAKLGIISLSDSKTQLNADLAKTSDELHATQADLAEQEARVRNLEQGGIGSNQSIPAPSASGNPSPAAASASVTPAPQSSPKSSASDANLLKYETLISHLDQLRKDEVTLLGKYTPQNEQVRRTQTQLSEVQSEKAALEKKFPDLPSRVPANSSERGTGLDLGTERARLAGIQAKVAALQKQLTAIRDRMEQFRQVGPQIDQLEQQKELEETNYKYFEGTLEKARVDEALDPSKIPNISAVQKASPPVAVTVTRNKIALGLAGGGLALGIVLALLRGILLDRTLKRPLEIEEELRISLLLSIPYHERENPTDQVVALPSDGNAKSSSCAVAPWDPNHFIRIYCDSIRDRLGLYFELHNLTHKPKLVGVTSFASGSGTSTLVAGLAAALSETGEGKVLLVDVNLGPEDVHPFFRGRPAYPLNAALRGGVDIDPVSENLYLAQVGSAKAGPAQLGLKKFFDLIPNLKASDFDYIIFDMPPLAQTSPSWGIAPFMDKLLLIVEAEKTHRSIITRGYHKLLAERSNVSIVFNKAHTYLPRFLDGEFDH